MVANSEAKQWEHLREVTEVQDHVLREQKLVCYHGNAIHYECWKEGESHLTEREMCGSFKCYQSWTCFALLHGYGSFLFQFQVE
mgnify:CR=1 FL=1